MTMVSILGAVERIGSLNNISHYFRAGGWAYLGSLIFCCSSGTSRLTPWKKERWSLGKVLFLTVFPLPGQISSSDILPPFMSIFLRYDIYHWPLFCKILRVFIVEVDYGIFTQYFPYPAVRTLDVSWLPCHSLVPCSICPKLHKSGKL